MKTIRANSITAALVLAGCFLMPLASAEDNDRGKRRGPPPEAIEACSGMEEGASCTFSGRRGDEVQGSCMTGPGGETVACAPEGGPPSRSRR